MLGLDELKNGITFWDFDGVLMPYRATADKTHIDEDEYIYRFIKDRANGNGLPDLCNYKAYSHLTVPALVSRVVNDLDSDKVYVLTAVSSVFEFEAKRKIIHDRYKNILDDHILFTASSRYKAGVINSIYEARYSALMSRSQMIMIDDTIEILEAVENLGFTGYHTSMLL